MNALTWTPAAQPPAVPGWYVVRLHLGGRPEVHWWGAGSTEWRAGATKLDVTHYLGPLPRTNREALAC